MVKRLLVTLLFVSVLSSARATHQRAGEITYKRLSELKYEVTIITYTQAYSLADRNELELLWGDGTSSILPRSNGPAGYTPAGYPSDHIGEIIGPASDSIRKNIYIGEHTYAGPATYLITLEDPNRNDGIMNIPNSVEVPFFLESQLVINPFVGTNNSPQLLLPPVDKACVGHPYLHNAGAYDPDGDSLSYSFVVCRGEGGEPIPGFKMPNEVDQANTSTFTINHATGDIVWDKPTMQGEYNFAFLVEEWRNGVRIGYVTRDMQIRVLACTNEAPEIESLMDTCVVAGDSLTYNIKATDSDFDDITLTATGQPFVLAISPAVFEQMEDTLYGEATALLQWRTDCSHIKKSAYQVYIKAADDARPVSLFDLYTLNIRVIGPKTENLSALPLGNSITIAWSPNRCTNAVSYNIYRRNGFYGYQPGYCETGVPASTGYRKIASVNGWGNTSYTDNDGGSGLVHGVDYCYIVTAVFPDGSEGIASDEACAHLKKDVAIITNVSIDKTSVNSGEVYLAWSKPTEIDQQQAPGPYKYLIYRSPDITWSNPVLIDSALSLNDTIYFDNPLNTSDNVVSYRVDTYNDTPGLRFLIGESQAASSVFITFAPGDEKLRINFNLNTPWINNQFVVFRQNKTTLAWDSIGYTDQNYFIDMNLVNGETYCYKVKSIGSYGTDGITDPLINWSQEACGIPVDNEPPCPPVPVLNTDCSTFSNALTWIYPELPCGQDVAGYYIWYKSPKDTALAVIDSVFGIHSTTFLHGPLSTIAGCYAVSAFDSIGNVSALSDTLCIESDTCRGYTIPNVFTPNGDTYNDYLVPFPYTSVERINLEIYNRWGRLVFKTEDPAIKWDGKILNTNQPASDGVYYYVCDVYEITLLGTVKRTIKGTVTILR